MSPAARYRQWLSQSIEEIDGRVVNSRVIATQAEREGNFMTLTLRNYLDSHPQLKFQMGCNSREKGKDFWLTGLEEVNVWLKDPAHMKHAAEKLGKRPVRSTAEFAYAICRWIPLSDSESVPKTLRGIIASCAIFIQAPLKVAMQARKEFQVARSAGSISLKDLRFDATIFTDVRKGTRSANVCDILGYAVAAAAGVLTAATIACAAICGVQFETRSVELDWLSQQTDVVLEPQSTDNDEVIRPEDSGEINVPIVAESSDLTCDEILKVCQTVEQLLKSQAAEDRHEVPARSYKCFRPATSETLLEFLSAGGHNVNLTL